VMCNACDFVDLIAVNCELRGMDHIGTHCVMLVVVLNVTSNNDSDINSLIIFKLLLIR